MSDDIGNFRKPEIFRELITFRKLYIGYYF